MGKPVTTTPEVPGPDWRAKALNRRCFPIRRSTRRSTQYKYKSCIGKHGNEVFFRLHSLGIFLPLAP